MWALEADWVLMLSNLNLGDGKSFELGHYGTSMVEIGEDYSGDLFSSVVIDGNNAITERTEKVDGGRLKYFFSLERLKNTIQQVEELGWPTKTVLKESTFNFCLKPDSTLTTQQKKALKQLKHLGMITLIPYSKDKDLDDKIMIQHALEHDSWILTGDTFKRDHIPKLLREEKFDTVNNINKRRVNLSFGPNHKPIFCLPQNLASVQATKVISDTQNLELELMSGGCPIWVSVPDEKEVSGVITMREPVGRKELLEIARSPSFKNAMNAVSRNHFKIDWDGQNFYLTDLNSTNGTKINDLKIPPHQPQKLSENDEITIGSVTMTLQ